MRRLVHVYTGARWMPNATRPADGGKLGTTHALWSLT